MSHSHALKRTISSTNSLLFRMQLLTACSSDWRSYCITSSDLHGCVSISDRYWSHTDTHSGCISCLSVTTCLQLREHTETKRRPLGRSNTSSWTFPPCRGRRNKNPGPPTPTGSEKSPSDVQTKHDSSLHLHTFWGENDTSARQRSSQHVQHTHTQTIIHTPHVRG